MSLLDNWSFRIVVAVVIAAIIAGIERNKEAKAEKTMQPATLSQMVDVNYINQTSSLQSNIVRIKDGCRVLYVTKAEIIESNARLYLTLANNAQITVSDSECLKDTNNAR